ncbi:MAG: trypsin-like peptidase domain-containing protein [Armatimonadota bacterium]
MKKIFKTISAFSILFILFAGSVFADQQAITGRQLVAKWDKAIVTIQLVVKTSVSYGGEDGGKRESKNEATGAVIDPSGLVVMSLSATSPEEAMGSMYSGASRDMKISSQITDIKIITANGTEIPAKIVLRDKDLDLAFIRPKKKPTVPMTAIDLKKAVKMNQFDEGVILYRQGNSANRQIAGVLDRVQTVLTKPRIQYAMGMSAMSASLGAPVFAMDGNVTGLLLIKNQPAGVTDNSSGLSSMGMMYIVLPAADIIDAAKQAPAQ